MTTAAELRAGFSALAQRSVSIMGACANEESAKLYLVLPVLTMLGYDISNPYEVYPGHTVAAGPSAADVDFAVLRQGVPVIAVEAMPVGADPVKSSARLAAYFNVSPTVKLGLLTDGILLMLYVDSAEPGRMDAEPFLTLDMETIAHGGISDEVLEPMLAVTKLHYDPGTIAEAAHVMLVKKRLRTVFLEEAKSPSEAMCRFALERAGIANVPRSAIERYYAPMVRSAFEESLVAPVMAELKASGSASLAGADKSGHPVEDRVESVERASRLLAYVRRRLAFLIDTEAQFAGLEDVAMKAYVGRTTFFYARERKGRLFDLVEGGDGQHKYIFPDPIGSIVTASITDIDEALKAVYEARVHELGTVALNLSRTKRFA